MGGLLPVHHWLSFNTTDNLINWIPCFEGCPHYSDSTVHLNLMNQHTTGTGQPGILCVQDTFLV